MPTTQMQKQPKVEFRQEEFPFSPLSDYRTATMTSEDTRGESHIGELVLKLDSLDDFFDDDDDDETLTDLPNVTSSSRYMNGPYSHDTRENLYDQQTAPILHKSLTRNASVTSFHTGFISDVKVSPARDPGVMTPGAFNSFTSFDECSFVCKQLTWSAWTTCSFYNVALGTEPNATCVTVTLFFRI